MADQPSAWRNAVQKGWIVEPGGIVHHPPDHDWPGLDYCDLSPEIVGPPSHVDTDDTAIATQHTVFSDGCWCQPVCRAHLAGALAFTLNELFGDHRFLYVYYEAVASPA